MFVQSENILRSKWLSVGGTGLVGSELCIVLRRQGNFVHSVGQKSSSHADHIIADVTETDWLKLINSNFYDYPAYLAYSNSSIISEGKAVNIDAALNLANHFHGSKLRGFIYLGSMTVFGQIPHQEVIKEFAPKIPNGSYASNKAVSCEELMRSSFTFNINILHPTNIYSRKSRSIKNWEKILRMNRINPGRNVLGIRNMVHSTDVANAIIEVSQRAVGNTNDEFIATGERVSLKDFFDLLSTRPSNMKALPLFLSIITRGPIRNVANRFGFITPMKPPKYKLKMMACSSTFDSQKIYEMTGWIPKKLFKFEMSQEK